MECPECEAQAICVDTEKYRHKPGEPITVIRTYACTNPECLEGFMYRSTYLKKAERLNAKKFIARYKRALEDKRTGQTKLEMDND